MPTVMRIYCVQYVSTCTPLGVGADLSCPHSPHSGNNTLYYIIVLLVLGHDESAPTPHGMFSAKCVLHLVRLTECSLLNVFCVWYALRCVYYNICPRAHRYTYLLCVISIHVHTVRRRGRFIVPVFSPQLCGDGVKNKQEWGLFCIRKVSIL